MTSLMQEREQNDPLTYFTYGLKASESRRQYPRRLKVLLDFLKLEGTLIEQATIEFIMTRFEEIMNAVTKNKNTDKIKKEDKVGVPGLTNEEENGNPAIDFVTKEQDLALTEQLYRGKHKSNDGSGGPYWDSE